MKNITEKQWSRILTTLSSLIKVNREDICKIGHTSYNNDGYLTVICSVDTYRLEELFLRKILQCFGHEYKTTDNYGCICEYDETDDTVEISVSMNHRLKMYDMSYETNLPYELYQKIIQNEQ